MDKPILEAWMTPGGDVSRSFYWCLERCLPGQQPRPLYAAQQQGQAVAWMTPETIAHLAKQNGPAKVDAWNCASGGARVPVYTQQPMQQGGGEVTVDGVTALAAEKITLTWAEYAALRDTAPPSAPVGVEAAEAMGARGGPASESERLAFEAWMRGHCWALCATWDGTGYRSDAEQGGRHCPDAGRTRGLWAAWRDRAALAQQPAAVDEARVVETIRKALHHSYGAGHTDYVNFTEALDFLATQH